MTKPTLPAPPPADAEFEAAVEQAISSCDGDARAAVRALLLTLNVYEVELATLRDDIACIRAAVSPGYVRGQLSRGRKNDG